MTPVLVHEDHEGRGGSQRPEVVAHARSLMPSRTTDTLATSQADAADKEFSTVTDLSQATYRGVTSPRGLVRVAGWCAYASGIVSIFGIVFLVAFFTTFIGPLGTLNDIAVFIQYGLMLPIALALHLLLRLHGPTLSLIALLLGVAGMVAVIVLQILLVAGVLPFAQQIGMVSVGFLVVLGWFMIIWYLGRSTGKLPSSMLLHVLAGLYFGYPVWAFSLGRRLRTAGLDCYG